MKVCITETIVHTFDVDAKDRDSARKEFDRMLFEGEVDYSYGELVDSKMTIEE